MGKQNKNVESGTSDLKITSIQELQKYKGGSIVELPPFAKDQPFVALMRRPSMLALVKSGKISNTLLTSANSLFAEGLSAMNDAADPDMMKKIFDIMDTVVDASLISPSLAELKEEGIELTDDQIMFIFSYSQTGVRALKNFRGEQTNSELVSDVAAVQHKTE